MSDSAPGETCEALIARGETLAARLEVIKPFPAEQYQEFIGCFAPSFRHHYTNYDNLLELLEDEWLDLQCTCDSFGGSFGCKNYEKAYLKINRTVRDITESIRLPLREQYEAAKYGPTNR